MNTRGQQHREGLSGERSLNEAKRGTAEDRLAEAVVARAQTYRTRLVACARRILGEHEEAEDVAQEVIIRAGQAARLRDPDALGGWLFATCTRRAIDRRRARERRTRLHAGAPERDVIPSAADAAQRRDELRRVRAAVETLDEPFRTAVRLRYLAGLSFADVAARTGAGQNTVRGRCARGLERLRQKLKRGGAA